MYEVTAKSVKEAKYRGFREAEENVRVCKITGPDYLYDFRELRPSNHLRNHSPDGHEWGYGGSGPAQLALSILADFYDELTALKFYQDFKWQVVAKLPYKEWVLTSEDIKTAIDKIAKERK